MNTPETHDPGPTGSDTGSQPDVLDVWKILLVAAICFIVGIGAVVWTVRIASGDGPMPPHRVPAEVSRVDQTLIDDDDRTNEEIAAGRLELQRYRWVDRTHGIAAIPIDKAIVLYVAKERR